MFCVRALASLRLLFLEVVASLSHVHGSIATPAIILSEHLSTPSDVANLTVGVQPRRRSAVLMCERLSPQRSLRGAARGTSLESRSASAIAPRTWPRQTESLGVALLLLLLLASSILLAAPLLSSQPPPWSPSTTPSLQAGRNYIAVIYTM